MAMDPNAGPAMPPELMAALTGGAGAGEPADTGGGGGEEQPIDILRQMIDMAQAYMAAEPDEVDKGTMAKVLAQIQAILAKDQSDRDKLLGNASTARVMRKS